MKISFLTAVLLGFLLLSCGSSGKAENKLAENDSLTAQIKNLLSEKKKILALKKQFEKSRYRKSLIKYRPIIRKYAKRYGFDWRLIAAQIMQESRFREKARSPVGARGLMQVMPRTAQELTRELDVQYILKNPRENIAAGIYHLKKQFGYFPNADSRNRMKLSLASYNCGAGRVFDSQKIAIYHDHSPNKWPNISRYLQNLKKSDWELHLQVWPLGKPDHGYFYGYNETITYVDRIWEIYQVYKKVL